MIGLEAQLRDYSDSLRNFKGQRRLPSSLFTYPDHIGIKAADNRHFDHLLELYKGRSLEVTHVRKDKRLLASAHLMGPMAVHGFGFVEWLEIMEPRPKKVGQDKVGLDHVEFYQPDITTTWAVLKDSDVVFMERDNGSHAWLEVTFGDNFEVKFNNKTLADVVAEDKEERRAFE